MKKTSIAVILGILVGTGLTSASAFAANSDAQNAVFIRAPQDGARPSDPNAQGAPNQLLAYNHRDDAMTEQSAQPAVEKTATTAPASTPAESTPAESTPAQSTPANTVEEPAMIVLTGPMAQHVHLNENKTAIVGFDPVHFQLNKSMLTPKDQQILGYYAQVLSNHPTHIELSGYTDGTGPVKYNQRLSQSRAQQVQQYLVQHGVDANMIKSKAFGEKDPIASNKTPEGRAENRRVELTVQS
ncbi:OmpA family protein [Celerinatantimonas diazotrophica]|uniref:OmpA family protein n=1 Tax=Celerinatantimonas diazotrophica TaxID=412034 RepID=A0A4R1J9Z7_9GAMM|nr:OmpA family protein [Celerinatantimonas diazotrophica]TCK46929.1 OmpA family protein [Celerinatantimonas diazotrophica]CAG9295697.1 Peptidoglycan-associated lipoprotein [Celerinatantimonas diazotrophica]